MDTDTYTDRIRQFCTAFKLPTVGTEAVPRFQQAGHGEALETLQIRAEMYLVLLRRLARYYWITLATNGSPAPRVAAALISRLALRGEDHGCEREITLRQRDIVRLTVMSRSAVAGGISRLTSADLIRIGDENSERFSGLVHVPDVDQLKDYALSEVREKQVRSVAEPSVPS